MAQYIITSTLVGEVSPKADPRPGSALGEDAIGGKPNEVSHILFADSDQAYDAVVPGVFAYWTWPATVIVCDLLDQVINTDYPALMDEYNA